MARSFRIAIIGIGAISDVHAKAIADLPQASLVAGSCRTPEKGQAFASKWHCTWYSDYNAMLDEARPDVAIIATPSGAHLQPTLACAERGVHALCEKPLEITTARADEMIRAAERAKIQLGGFFPQRFNPVVQTLHQAVAQGRFGRLATINVIVPWWRDDDYYAPQRWQGTLALDGGGALINQGIHLVDLMQWLGGATMSELRPGDNPVRDVFCFADKLAHDPELIEVEDTAVAVARLRNGALVNILAATSMHPGSHWRLLVAGSDGSAEIVEDQLISWNYRQASDEDEIIRARFSGKTAHGGGAADPMAMGHANHTGNLRDFLDALEAGRPPLVHAIEARKALAITQACYDSASTGSKTSPAPLSVDA